MSKQKCSEFIWIQRDGSPIHVRQMTDKHLLCTIRLLRRWNKRIADKYNQEQESMIWDADDAKDAFWFPDDSFLGGHPTWGALQFERRVRGLDELPAAEQTEPVRKEEGE